MNQPMPQVQLPPEVMPQPLPCAWIVQPHPNGYVVITIFDATGQRVLILAHADAQKLVDDITAQIPTARSGLVVPGGIG